MGKVLVGVKRVKISIKGGTCKALRVFSTSLATTAILRVLSKVRAGSWRNQYCTALLLILHTRRSLSTSLSTAPYSQ